MNVGIRAALGQIIIIGLVPTTTYPRRLRAPKVCGLVGQNWCRCRRRPHRNGGGRGTGFGARLVAAILSSPFRVGHSKFRTSREAGFVDTVPFGAFRREIFDRVGLYNEKLVRNQDNELNARIRKAGGRIYLTPALDDSLSPCKKFRGSSQIRFQTDRVAHLHGSRKPGIHELTTLGSSSVFDTSSVTPASIFCQHMGALDLDRNSFHLCLSGFLFFQSTRGTKKTEI